MSGTGAKSYTSDLKETELAGRLINVESEIFFWAYARERNLCRVKRAGHYHVKKKRVKFFDLFFKSAYMQQERSDLFIREFLACGGHLPATMLDGVDNPLVIYSFLPLRIGEVSHTYNLAVVISGAILTVTLSASLLE
jgi:hypothetical protein